MNEEWNFAPQSQPEPEPAPQPGPEETAAPEVFAEAPAEPVPVAENAEVFAQPAPTAEEPAVFAEPAPAAEESAAFAEPAPAEPKPAPTAQEEYPNPFAAPAAPQPAAPQYPAQPNLYGGYAAPYAPGYRPYQPPTAPYPVYPSYPQQPSYPGYPQQPGYPQPAYRPQPGYGQPAAAQSVNAAPAAPQPGYSQPSAAQPAASTPAGPENIYSHSVPVQPAAPYGQPYRQSVQGAGTGQPPFVPAGFTYAQSAPKKSNGGKIALWILAAILELVLVGFAIYGIYALCTGNRSETPSRPSAGQQEPGKPEKRENDDTSSAPSNYTNVQMGIICQQMTEEFWEMYPALTPGLVVQSIDENSNAIDTDLQEGDVIIAANGTEVQTFEDLFAVMDTMYPGDEIHLKVYHVEQELDGTVSQGEPFTVVFRVKAKETESEPASSYPQA